MKDNIYIERMVKVCMTPQAQKVLSHTPYTIDEFIDWSLHQNNISFGGHNVAVFLEHKYNEVNK